MSRCEVAIVGAGPAGLGAAIALRRLGVRDVVVLEREAEAGGVPRHCGHAGFGLVEFHRLLTGPAYARRLARLAADIDVRTATTVTALAPHGTLWLAGRDGVDRLAARAVLLATGARETPRGARLVGGTRGWGVTTTGALQQLVHLARIRPFESAVVVGSELVSFSALLTLRHGGIRPVAMIEEGPRIVARRPADLLAHALLGVPVLTRTRLTAIRGDGAVQGVDIERDGEVRTLACGGVVFTGSFVPEAALVRASHLELDPATGGPVIDQHWRCSDPAYFCAGNLLRGIEPAGRCFREGAAAARAIARALRGALPPPARRMRVATGGPLRYVYPQVLAAPGEAVPPLLLKARAARETRGRLILATEAGEIWSRRVHLLPERRIDLPAGLVVPGAVTELRVELCED